MFRTKRPTTLRTKRPTKLWVNWPTKFLADWPTKRRSFVPGYRRASLWDYTGKELKPASLFLRVEKRWREERTRFYGLQIFQTAPTLTRALKLLPWSFVTFPNDFPDEHANHPQGTLGAEIKDKRGAQHCTNYRASINLWLFWLYKKALLYTLICIINK